MSEPDATGSIGAAAAAHRAPARFLEGSTMRHVATMTATGTLGLMAVFAVDFLNLFYISLLGEAELAAAIGYAGTLLAFNVAIGIGMSIAATVLVARALGAGDVVRARRVAAAALVFVALVSALLSVLLFPAIPLALGLLGAGGRTAEIAAGFLRIVVPSMPVLVVGMTLAGLLRAAGDARRAMYVTLAGGIASAVLDPLFIFGLDFGVTGAAIATVVSRFVLASVGWHGASRVHELIGRFAPASFLPDVRALSAIAVPAVLANIATPVGNAYVTAAIARFGDDAVAGWAIIGRIIPLAFGAIFALTGAVGPIIGQNVGGGRLDRVRRTLRDALVLTSLYTLFVWALLFVLRAQIVALFGAEGDAASLVRFFCGPIAGSFLFSGGLFVANAAFNNLGFATYSTLFNWGRATLGTIPFVWLGSRLAGAEGALIGWAGGGIVFGIAATIVAFRATARLKTRPPDELEKPALSRPALSPLSSGKSQLG